MAWIPIVRGKLMQNELQGCGIEGWSRQQQALSRRWFACAIPLEVLNLVWHRSHGVDAASRQTSTWYRQPTNATVLFAQDAPGARI